MVEDAKDRSMQTRVHFVPDRRLRPPRSRWSQEQCSALSEQSNNLVDHGFPSTHRKDYP